MMKALKVVKPSVSKKDLIDYERWTYDFGSEGDY